MTPQPNDSELVQAVDDGLRLDENQLVYNWETKEYGPNPKRAAAKEALRLLVSRLHETEQQNAKLKAFVERIANIQDHGSLLRREANALLATLPQTQKPPPKP